MPAPFAIAANSAPLIVAVAILGTESVVMIACALVCNPSLLRTGAIASSPEMILSIGRNSPISPVEQTITSPAETLSKCPTCSAVLCVSAKPCGPVHALAPPLLSTAALTVPPFATWRDQITGAATTLFEVKTAAPMNSGPWFWINVKSRAPVLFNPAAIDADLNPCGSFMPRHRQGPGH